MITKNTAASTSPSGLPVQSNEGPQGPYNNIFAVRERSLCVNDGSLVIPSHVCSDFGFAYTYRHKSTLQPFFLSSLSWRCLIFQNWYWPPHSTLWRRTGLDLCYFWSLILFCPVSSWRGRFPSKKFSLIFLHNANSIIALSVLSVMCLH